MPNGEKNRSTFPAAGRHCLFSDATTYSEQEMMISDRTCCVGGPRSSGGRGRDCSQTGRKGGRRPTDVLLPLLLLLVLLSADRSDARAHAARALAEGLGAAAAPEECRFSGQRLQADAAPPADDGRERGRQRPERGERQKIKDERQAEDDQFVL